MLLLSYNVKGVGGASKLTTLRRKLELKNPKILAIQEALMAGEKEKEVNEGILEGFADENY